MGFHDALFPKHLSYGTRGGAGYATQILDTDGAQQARRTGWPLSQSRAVFDVAKSVQSDDDLAEMISFYRCRRGAANAFRFWDRQDWSTNPSGEAAPTHSNRVHRSVLLPESPSASQLWAIKRDYYDAAGPGLSTMQRRVYKPMRPEDEGYAMAVYVADAPIHINGVDTIPSLLKVAIDHDQGQVWFSLALPASLLVAAAFTYHAPCRFGDDADARLEASWDESGQFSFASIPIVEEPSVSVPGLDEPTCGPEEWWAGGYYATTIPAGTYQVDFLNGVFQRFSAAAPRTLWLPDVTSTATQWWEGGPWFLLHNSGSQTLTVQLFGGAANVGTIASGQAMEVHLATNSAGAKTWVTR